MAAEAAEWEKRQTALLEAEVGRLTRRLTDRPDVPRQPRETAQDLLARGDLLARLDRMAEAEADYERAAALTVDDPDVAHRLHMLGIQHARRQDWSAAARLLDGGVERKRRLLGDRNAELARALHHLGEQLWILGDAAGAAGCLREAVAIRTWQLGPAHPDTLDTRQSLADVLFATDDYGATEAVLLDGLSPPPGRERANAGPLPQQQARLLRQLDSLYRTRGALQPAAAAEARARWAKVMWRGVEQAIAELDDRIGEGGHNDPNLLARRAALYTRARRFKEAAADLDRVVELEPGDTLAWLKRAVAYLAAGDAEGYRRAGLEAVEAFRETRYPTAARRTVFANLLHPPAPGSDEELFRRLEPLVRVTRNDLAKLGSHQVIGVYEYRRGRFKDAAEWLENSLARNAPALRATSECYLAMAYHHLGRGADARTTLARAVERITTLEAAGEPGPAPHEMIYCEAPDVKRKDCWGQCRART